MKNKSGFLLVDALICIFIVLVLIAIVTNTVSSHYQTKMISQEVIERMQDENNMNEQNTESCDICTENQDSS